MTIVKPSKSKANISRTSFNDEKNVYKSDSKRPDRNIIDKNLYAMNLEANKVDTLLLLLNCEELELIEQILHYLDVYANASYGNLYELWEKKIHEKIMNNELYKSKSGVIYKFSLKHLVQLIHDIPDSKTEIITDCLLLDECIKLFLTSDDPYAIEYVSFILLTASETEITAEKFGKNEKLVKMIFAKVNTSQDPDLLLNCLNIILVLCKCQRVYNKIIDYKEYPIKKLIEYLQSEYLEIKDASLSIFERLAVINKDNPRFDNEFMSKDFLDNIFAIIETGELKDLHLKGFNVLKDIAKNSKISLKIIENEYFARLLTWFINEENPLAQNLALKVLIVFAEKPDIRKILQENSIVPIVVELLKTIKSIESCIGVSVLSEDFKALDDIFVENIYNHLLIVAWDETKDIICRECALSTFNKLICQKGQTYLTQIAPNLSKFMVFMLMKEFDQKFLPMLLTVVDMLEKLCCYEEIQTCLSTPALAESIIYAFENSSKSTKLLIRMFDVSSMYLGQATFVTGFVSSGIHDVILYHLATSADILRVTIFNFILTCSEIVEFCEKFIDKGILKILLENEPYYEQCADACDNILNSDPAMKFAVRNELEVTDKIESGFYATKKDWIDFMELRKIMKFDFVSPFYPIYYVNFDASDIRATRKSSLTGQSIEKLMKRFHEPTDRFLVEMINGLEKNEQFKCACDPIDKLKYLAQRVAKFLQTNEECISHQLEVNLAEQKCKYQCAVIPIGSLIYGNSFEAALMFKALADVFEIESTLRTCRKTGKSWNEVSNCSNIIDLFCNPGEMYAINGPAACNYLQTII